MEHETGNMYANRKHETTNLMTQMVFYYKLPAAKIDSKSIAASLDWDWA